MSRRPESRYRPGGSRLWVDRRTYLLSLATGLFLFLQTRFASAESLQDAWNAALGANLGLQATQLGSAASQQLVAAARAERVPTLTTVNAYTWLDNSPTFKSSFPLPGSRTPLNVTVPFLNREFFLSSTLANVPLYTGGRILAGIDAAGAQAGAARAEAFTAVLDLKLEVTQAYLNVLRLDKLLRLARTNVTSLQAHERDVTNLFQEGVARRTDLLSSQVSLARAQQRVIQVNNELAAAWSAYNRLLGRSLTTPPQLEEMALRHGSDPGPLDLRSQSKERVRGIARCLRS